MSASAKLADLEALLRARRLDRTLIAPDPVSSPDMLARVELPTIDAALRGGFPRGQLSELVGVRSSGRTTVLHALCAAATARGELVALVDCLDTFDPPSANRAGVDLDRLLWVRGSPGAQGSLGRGSQGPQGSLLQLACERALKAFNLVLQAGGYGLVVLDLAELPVPVLRRIPIMTWLRLQRGIEGRDGAALLIADCHLSRSARGVTLELAAPLPFTVSPHSPWELPPFQLGVARCVRSAAVQ